MSSQRPIRWCLVPMAMLAAAMMAAGTAGAAAGPEAARLAAFAQPDGTHCFALGLKPAQAAPAARHDLVV
ncbi:MAG: hypothetical protein NUV77_23270, partial [Thermoguttaceae bacterium]|nr:hypothetical protein [Thermoguttaceae bacterium]